MVENRTAVEGIEVPVFGLILKVGPVRGLQRYLRDYERWNRHLKVAELPGRKGPMCVFPSHYIGDTG
jgi:hypothetical protein